MKMFPTTMAHRLVPAGVAVAALALAGCAIEKPAPLGPQPTKTLGTLLTAPQVHEELVGNTGTGTRTGTNTKWTIYVAPDGTLQSRSPQPSDTGTWRITDDGKFCMTWKREWHGQEVCQTVHRAGSGVELASAHSVEEMVFTPGKRL